MIHHDSRLCLTWESFFELRKTNKKQQRDPSDPRCVESHILQPCCGACAKQQPAGAPLTPKGGKTKTSMPH